MTETHFLTPQRGKKNNQAILKCLSINSKVTGKVGSVDHNVCPTQLGCYESVRAAAWREVRNDDKRPVQATPGSLSAVHN